GGMGGCAMIGQTMINVKTSGARTRISTFLAGVFLLILTVVLGDLVGTIPMAVLVAIMVMVSVGTFDWHSIKDSSLKRMSKSERAIMVITVAVGVGSSSHAISVVVVVFAASVMFVRRIAQLIEVRREVKAEGDQQVADYTVQGKLLI